MKTENKPILEDWSKPIGYPGLRYTKAESDRAREEWKASRGPHSVAVATEEA